MAKCKTLMGLAVKGLRTAKGDGLDMLLKNDLITTVNRCTRMKADETRHRREQSGI